MALIIYIIPVYLLDKDFSFPVITLISGLAAIPWLIKFFWGGIVDYFIRFGRKKFIIMGGILSSICLIILFFIDPKNFLIPFSIFLFLSHLGILFIDVSADAWAIDISKKKERGKINASMVTGMTIGISFGATLFAVISKNISFNYALLTAGLIVLLLLIFPFFVKEAKKVKKYEKITKILFNELKKKTTILIAVFGLFLLINQGLQFILPLFERTVLNLDIVQIGLLGNLGIIWIVSGAIVGGYLSDRWGRKRILFIFIIICMIFSASLIFVRKWEDLIIYAPIGFSFSAFNGAFLAMAMDITNPRVGATQFSIITSISNVGEWFGSTISGTIVEILGFSHVFLYSALVLGIALLILYFIRFESNDKKIVKNL